PDPYANFATFEAFYDKQDLFDQPQKLLYMIDQDIIQSMTLQVVLCVIEFESSSEIAKLRTYALSQYRQFSQEHIEHDKKQKLEALRLHFSYLITIFMDALSGTNKGRERAKTIVATAGLSDLLVGFIDPDYSEVKRDYLDALDVTIEFFSPQEVEKLVQNREILLRLSKTAMAYRKQDKGITNLAVKILASVAKHGIKLGEGAVSFSVMGNTFAVMMQQVAQGQIPKLPETKKHPFQEKCEKDGADTTLLTIFQEKMIELKDDNKTIIRSNGTDPDNEEEQILYTRLACASCVMLFHNGRQLFPQHQLAIDTLAEEIYPIRLIQSVANSNVREHRAMLEKRLEDASMAIVALSYILRVPANHIYTDINVITRNLEQYMNLTFAFPNTDVKNALGLLVTLAQTISTSHIAALVNGSVVQQIRALQAQKKEVDVIEKFNILDIIIAQHQVKMSGSQQMQTSTKSTSSNSGTMKSTSGTTTASNSSPLSIQQLNPSPPISTPVQQQQFKSSSNITPPPNIILPPPNNIPAQQQQFVIPSNQAFEPTSNQAFGQTSNQAFGQTSNQAFGQTSNQAFGQTSNQAFGPTSNQAFGQTSNQAFGQTSNQAFGQTSNQAFGPTSNQAFGLTQNQTYGSQGQLQGQTAYQPPVTFSQQTPQQFQGTVQSSLQQGSYIAPQVNYQQQTYTQTPLAYPNVKQTGHANIQQSGYPNAQQSGYPNAQQSSYPNAQQSGYPTNQPAAYPNIQQPSYPNTQQQSYTSTQQQAFPNVQQPAYPNAYTYAQPQTYSNTQPQTYPGSQPQNYTNVQPSAYPN
ncbi:MAG: hypothetical protein EZS28_033271, partial [Streblomastix strix]